MIFVLDINKAVIIYDNLLIDKDIML